MLERLIRLSINYTPESFRDTKQEIIVHE